MFDLPEEENLPVDGNIKGDPIKEYDKRPVCTVHNVVMRIDSTSAINFKRYYTCPVPTCEQRSRRMRPNYNVPKEGQKCPICSKAKQPVFCSVVWFRYTLKYVCENKCGFTMVRQRPDIKNQIRKYRGRSTYEDSQRNRRR